MEERDGQPTVCHQQVKEVNRSETFYCSPVRLGRYVKIQKRGPVARGDILALCEVEVYGNNTGEVIMAYIYIYIYIYIYVYIYVCVCVCVCVHFID